MSESRRFLPATIMAVCGLTLSDKGLRYLDMTDSRGFRRIQMSEPVSIFRRGRISLKNQRYINRYLRSRQIRLLLAIAIGSQLSACAHQPETIAASPALQFSTEVSVCRDMLADVIGMGAELDSSNISLFNWNVHKTRERGWRDDFDALAGNADLVLFQEASLREETIAEIDSSRHWSFAPGYRRRGEVTGVMTLSSIKPMTQCSFVHSEPWLRTPKATSVTQYALTDTDKTLDRKSVV